MERLPALQRVMALGAALVLCLSGVAAGAGGILPAAIGAWSVDGKAALFTPERLHEHINGEAELYFPYGFVTLETAAYVREGATKATVVVDAYLMGSALDAFGIYSRYRDPDSEPVKVGSDGIGGDEQLLFCKDRYFIRLSVSGDVNPGRDGLMVLARAVEAAIPSPPALPRELLLLQIPGLVPRSESYVAKSLMGYAFFKKGLRGEAKGEGKPASLFVVLDDSDAAADASLEAYIRSLRGAGATTQVREEGGATTLLVVDPLYKGVAVRRSGPFLIGVARLEDPASGLPLLKSLEGRAREFQISR